MNQTKVNGAAASHHETIIIGGGFAGIGAAIKLGLAGADYILLEKSHELGGVWRDNTYPDCGCDVPSALYSYSFAPNPKWQRVFAKQEEIKQYTLDTVKKFAVMERVRLNQELMAATWSESEKLWHLQTNTGLYKAKFVIMACGPMHVPITPDIKGLDTFSGIQFHSARWNHDYDLTDKRVAVIGSGASAIQFLPAIQSKVKSLTLFQRTPPWVLPKLDMEIPQKWQQRFTRYPFLQSLFRKFLYLQFELFNSSLKKPRLAKRIQAVGVKHIGRAIKDESLRAKLTPNFRVGCKRILLSNKWYRALAKSNVQVVSGVVKVQGNRVFASDGASVEVDAIIFGTGFEVANPPIAQRIKGMSGKPLSDIWQGSPDAYLGTMTQDCPNMFLTFGPNLYTFSSAFVIIEAQLKYIVDAINKTRDQQISTIKVNATKSAGYNQALQSSLQDTVWNSGCSSYFIDKNGLNSTNWPWTTFYMRKRLSRFKLSDHVIEKQL